MKLNWGTGIVITIIAFIAFIMYFVITMSTDHTYSHDLVTEKYYQKELQYQEEIDAEKNLNKLTSKVTVQRTDKGLKIELPKEFKNKNIEGKVFLYRPSNKQLDFDIPISTSNTYLLVPEQRLVDGRWNIIVFWTHKNKPYLFKNEIIY